MPTSGQPSRRFGLARALSKLGYCSRSRAVELIRSGAIRLNGKVMRNPEFPVLLGSDEIMVRDAALTAGRKLYLLLNKPRGVVTTASDEKGRRTVYDLFRAIPVWVAPVGRLDKASEGLLLLTNDSKWAAHITDPESHLDKTYHIQIGTVADPALFDSLLRGFRVGNGDFLRVKMVRMLRHGKRNSWLEVTLDEGKNRHLRRMFDHLGIPVLRLVRVAIGPLTLGDLPKGTIRELTPAEREQLRAFRPKNEALG
jgi:23S rRNA pseudouridine2605 synthase